jgi:hypothetical protein
MDPLIKYARAWAKERRCFVCGETIADGLAVWKAELGIVIHEGVCADRVNDARVSAGMMRKLNPWMKRCRSLRCHVLSRLALSRLSP